MKLMLVCNAGMSTSMLVSKIERAAKDQGIELEVAAFPLTQAEKAINDWDVVRTPSKTLSTTTKKSNR